MKTVQIRRELLAAMEGAARSEYPLEACGFLFSPEAEADGPNRVIAALEPTPNDYEGERRRRFVITPTELRSAEARAQRRGEVVSGFYHSHPDHPAVPSAFDTEHAWPWYAYLVVSVDREGRCVIGAYELEAERLRFVARELHVGTMGAPHSVRSAPAAGG